MSLFIGEAFQFSSRMLHHIIKDVIFRTDNLGISLSDTRILQIFLAEHRSNIFLLSGVNKGGVQRFNGHLYWFSWQDDDNSVRNAKWDWFNARNYCRKRCMDLVSFETREEYEWVKGFINGEWILLGTCLQMKEYVALALSFKAMSHFLLFQSMFHTSGPQEDCATLMVVIDQTSSPRTSTAGSGQQTRRGWLLLTAELLSMTGLALEGELERQDAFK